MCALDPSGGCVVLSHFPFNLCLSDQKLAAFFTEEKTSTEESSKDEESESSVDGWMESFGWVIFLTPQERC